MTAALPEPERMYKSSIIITRVFFSEIKQANCFCYEIKLDVSNTKIWSNSIRAR